MRYKKNSRKPNAKKRSTTMDWGETIGSVRPYKRRPNPLNSYFDWNPSRAMDRTVNQSIC